MHVATSLESVPHRILASPVCAPGRPLIIVGVTHPQTCMILTCRLRALRLAGFRVILVCSPGDLFTETARDAEVEWIALPIERTISPLADLRSLWRLWLLMVRHRPQITEFSTPKAGLLGTLAARMARVPHRIYLLRGLKLESSSGWKRRLLMAAERLAASSAHRVLCNSASLCSEVLRLGLAPASQLHMLGDGSSQGVDTKHFSPGSSRAREALEIPAAAPVIGYVGRLTCDKGLPELVDAFLQILCAIPDTHLLLVGWFDTSEDALPPQLRSRIAAHPQIHVTGMVPDTAAYYRAMDLMVFPTWREGFPNAVLEAASTGLPVITTLCTGSRDAVVPEVTGLLIPPGYPEAICEAALKLLRNPERRAEMGKAARAWVVKYYSNERVIGLTVDFYRGLIGKSEEAADKTQTKPGEAMDSSVASVDRASIAAHCPGASA